MKNILRAIILLSFLFLSGKGGILVQEALCEEAKPATLYIGEIKALAVDNPTKVMISKPDIADVVSVSKNEMLIIAKAKGATGLTWEDSLGKHFLQLEVFTEAMGPVKEHIDSILKELNFPGVFTRRADSESKVLLLGRVKTSQELERANVALASLKDKLINLIQVKEEEAMVEIGVQVLELSKDASRTLGFTWPGSLTITEKGSSGISDTGTGWGTLFKILNVNRAAFSWRLDALAQEGKARILSQPRLACQSGKEAELLVGGEKPIFTTSVAASTGAEATSVSYKEFGIKLNIKPTVTDNKQVKLALNVEVSEIGVADTIGSSSAPTAKAYPLTKRSASTELFLNDGQTMAIGGLRKQKAEEDIVKTPFIGDVPILGLFFRKKSIETGGGSGERGDTELFITLTPHIIKEEIAEEEPQLKPQPQPEVGVSGPAKPEAPVAPKEDEAIIKEEPKPEVKAKAKPPKKIKVKKVKKEKVRKEKAKKEKVKKEAKVKASLKGTPPKEMPKPEAEATAAKEEPMPQPEVLAGPEIGIGAAGGAAGGVFPKGIITKEALKPKAEAKVKTKVSRPKKEKVKKAKKVKKEPKVKVSLREAPPKEMPKPMPQPLPLPQLPLPQPEVKVLGPVKAETQAPVSVRETLTGQVNAQALSAYLAKIAQRIQDKLVYPWVARQMNLQGSLILGMHIFNTGQLLDLEVRHPSGCAMLDEDAVRTVKEVAPFPPFPSEINQKELRIDLPIIYKIE